MALARGALLTVYFATLFYDKTPAPAVAFNLPLGEARSQQFFKRSSMVFSQSLSMESEPRQDSSPKLGAAGRRRARDIVTLTRRRSRATARQTRSPAKAPYQEPRSQVHIQQRTRGEISPMLEASRREGVQSRPPSPAASPQEGSSGGELTKSLKVEAPAEKQRRVGKDVDWMRRRVQEILEEYSRKAPTAEQWPPGRRIRVRGVDIHYKDTGSRGRGKVQGAPKDRPVFMCLHGLAGSTASWDEVITDLSEYGRVISFDRPGFGKTERVMPFRGLPWRLSPQTLGENPYSSDFAAKVMFGLLDRLGVDKIILVAHSLGAQVALRAARTRPDMVRAMVLVAPAVLNPLDTKFVMGRDPNANLFSPIVNLRTRVEITAKLAAFNLQLLQPGETPLETVRNITLRGDVEERVQRNFHDRSLPSDRPELISKYIEPLRDPLWDRGLLHFYKSLQGEVQPGEQLLQKTLDVWKGPSMVITGDNDPTVPTQSSVYVAEAMEGRLVVVETCAHIPMDEKSEVFSSAVLSFADSEEVRNAWVAGGNSTNSW